MNKLPLLADYMARAEGPDLIKAVSPDGKYVKFKYTDTAIFNGHWDEITLNARGHVFRLLDGECVLRPWSKFFNFSELFSETGQPTNVHKILSGIPGMEPDFNVDDPHVATDKLDGSLCIAGIVDDDLLVTTSGSFTAWQGAWAKAWLIENGVQTHMVPGFTYLFEIIADEDLHPIRYDYQGCVLTGIIDNATGVEQPYAELQRFAASSAIRVTQQVTLNSFEETLDYVKALPANKEGLVITYLENGFKLKLKGPEFLAVQRLFHGLSEKSLMGTFDPDTMKFPEDTRKMVPEEFTELTEFMDKFEKRYAYMYYAILGLAIYCKMHDVAYGSKDIYDRARYLFGDCPQVIGTACAFTRKWLHINNLQEMQKASQLLGPEATEALTKTILNENKNKD